MDSDYHLLIVMRMKEKVKKEVEGEIKRGKEGRKI